jgi:hypothetical protein
MTRVKIYDRPGRLAQLWRVRGPALLVLLGLIISGLVTGYLLYWRTG